MMRKLLVCGCAGAVLATAAACGGGSMDSTDSVCDEFAAHAKAGLPEADRAKVVASMGKVIDNADQKVRDAYPGLQRAVDKPDSTYQKAADVFAQSCFDAGWKG